MSQRKRCWQVRQQFLVDSQSWSRWDRAYQMLLLVAHNKPVRIQKEETHESSQLRAGFDTPPSAVAND